MSGSRLLWRRADGSVGTMLLMTASDGGSSFNLVVDDEIERSMAVK